MRGLRSILGDSVKQAGGARRIEEKGCIDLWPTVVGESIADATRAERMRDGILFVVARTSVWAFELTFVKEGIIRNLNDRLGRPLIRDIRFKVGPLEAPAAPPVPEESPSRRKLPDLPEAAALPERARSQVEGVIAAIKDERVRERTRRTLERQAMRREQKQRLGWQECPRCGTLHPDGGRLCPLCRLHIRT